MRPTSHLDDVARRIDAVEDIGGVGLEEALVFFEDARRSIARLRGGVVVDRVRMIAVADECPQASRLSLGVAMFQHRQTRLVGLHDS